MIKLPISPLTPPIKIKTPSTQPSKPTKPQNPGTASGGGGSGGGGGSQNPDSGKTNTPSLDALFKKLLGYYDPETVGFTPIDEDTLAETIGKWLRPAFEQAIDNRRRETERINAELDADAWSRGMGSGSYLSDVKERQYRGEASDIDALEGSYASQLAGHLYDAMKEQQAKKVEVDKFNAEQINHAREQAMNAAQALYNALLAKTGGGSGSGKSGGRSSSSGAGGSTGDSILDKLLDDMNNSAKSSYKTIANTVSRMSPQERRRLYDRSDPKYMTLRSEILWSLGEGEYAKLMKAFPGA